MRPTGVLSEQVPKVVYHCDHIRIDRDHVAPAREQCRQPRMEGVEQFLRLVNQEWMLEEDADHFSRVLPIEVHQPLPEGGALHQGFERVERGN